MSKNQKQTYKVFVSSTYIDNQERRRIVQDVITRAGMVWHGMEQFTASTRPVVEECLRYVREADVLIGIIVHRYGWEPDGKKSITEMEYNEAKERLMFLIDQKLPVFPESAYDQDGDTWDKQKKLAAFRKKIAQDQLPAPFTETTLGAIVLDSLNKWREKKEGGAKKQKPLKSNEPIPPSIPDMEKEIHSYCQKAASLHENLPVAGFATHIKVTIDLEDIYVPLRAMVNLQGVSDESFRDAEHAEKCYKYVYGAEFAAQFMDPSRVCGHIFAVAQAFNQFYNKHLVLGAESPQLVSARLELVRATAQILKNGLQLLGIDVLEVM